MDAKSVITAPSPQVPIAHGPGPLVITGLAWSGRGAITRVEAIAIDAGAVDGDLLTRDAERDHVFAQRVGYGEQPVGGAFGETVGVLDDDDAPAPDRRRRLRLQRQIARFAHLDREAARRDDLHVGVGAVDRRPALATLPAPALRALERGSERASRVGTARAGRAGDEPRMRHATGVADGLAQRAHRLLLTDEITPYALADARHPAGRRDVTHEGPPDARVVPLSRSCSSRVRTAAVRSSRERPASRTR